MEIGVIFAEDTDEGNEVDDEEKGPQDAALGYTSGDEGRLGTERLELDEVSVT